MNPRRIQLLGVGLTAIVCLQMVLHADRLAAESKWFGKKATSSRPASAGTAAVPQNVLEPETEVTDEADRESPVPKSGRPNDKRIKLNYLTKTWDDVLKDVAKQSDLALVMDKVPPGRFSRNDWNRYSMTETLRILNSELEPKGFRVLDRGKFLNVVFLRDARQEYSRPVIDVAQVANAKPMPKSSEAALPTSRSGVKRTRGDSNIQLANYDLEDDDNDDDEAMDVLETPKAVSKKWVEIDLKYQPAKNVSRALYRAFLDNAELVEQGPNGHPGFVVWSDDSKSANRTGKVAAPRQPRFAVGIDTKNDKLFVDGSPREVASVRRVVAKLDVSMQKDDRAVRLIASKRDAREIAQVLRPAVKELAHDGEVAVADKLGLQEDNAPAKAQAPKGTVRTKTSAKAAAKNAEKKKGDAADAQANVDSEMPKTDEKSDSPTAIGGLKGDVNVEALDNFLILRGNEQDVEAVMNIIRQIELMSAGTVPDIHVRMLEHVDSDSLAELLTSVYERLNRSRGRTAQDGAQQITVIAVGKPNAVMVLASENDVKAVDTLIDELDKPVDPISEFEVFRLRYAVASQVETAINSFFGSGTSSTTTGGTGQQTGQSASARTTSGLRGRVKVITDARGNSVIVQARSRDLEEVTRFIGELDQVGNQAVSQIKLIPLKNALADEMAEMLNLAIQSVVSPPQQARTNQQGGGGGFGGQGGGAQGQVDQKLREAKSAVLQLLGEDSQELIESGILTDIRINADSRTNSLVVTAPEESHALVQALVKKFDKPSAMVAEIKHFTLKNADASSVVRMLNELFNNQQQGQGQGQGQRAGNQQNQQLGIQLAGAEDASSQLIPLKFSVDVRTNSIIAVGGAEALSVVEAIMFRLDASDARQRQSTVYRLKNSPAQEVANAITLFLQGQRDLNTQGNQDLVSDIEQLERQVIVVAEPNSNSLMISATPRYFKDITEMITRIDAAKPEVVIQALLVEVALDNTDEFGVELGFQNPILFNRSNILNPTNGGLTSVTQQTIQNTNSTTTSVTPGTGATTTTTTITPSSLTTSIPNIVGLPGFNFNNQPFGNNTAAPNPGQVGSQGLSSFNMGRTSTQGFGGLVLSAGSDSINVLLRALSASRKVEILSRPQIRTLDSQTGTINVGQIVPVVNGITANGIAGQFTPQILRDPAGIIMEVTPRITPDDRIVMQIHAERSRYDLLSTTGSVTLVQAGAASGAITSPVKEISTALTTVSVSNEQTIVIGGMIQKTDDKITRKVPWLGDIPIIGQAFRYDSRNVRRVELLIFLTPRIIKNDSVSEIIKQIEAERLHYTECEAEALHGPLFGTPAPPSDGSTPPVYAPGDLWTPPSAPREIVPPAPQDGNAPGVLPMSSKRDDHNSGVQSASYQVVSDSDQRRTTPVSSARAPTRKTPPARKPTILDSFPRDRTMK